MARVNWAIPKSDLTNDRKELVESLVDPRGVEEWKLDSEEIVGFKPPAPCMRMITDTDRHSF